MSRRTKALGVIGGALLALGLLGLSAGALFAQTPPATQTPTPAATTLTHEQMDQMMDAMHGEGTSQRMHEAMGPQAEQMMDQCVGMMTMMGNMMGMMQGMQGMMGAGASGMMGGQTGMMGGQQGQSIQDMMQRMTGR